ncbi:hypothetical protein CAOG_07451 [Capsaspora owczarzaki ATCC 30864]|uniref:Uncharacterized protein n=1 Tax=Capsaspora owczarzaki (strain ATCC 30864) TaxID=595528 RepID=A0A0D2X5D6_CAPO3|nr:hypothetical protein CAOG_07451 [Capsaspora owczarzaki ATCC 30864]KJE97624.1 hypothetical protein CAOG_007451 [Capsaspora owczarzaki ATCC 30864]|eukprot:XP_004343310.1 hypothetical protein CAOG_07451 [Capsaspora owczarzaki ATCC 30864]
MTASSKQPLRRSLRTRREPIRHGFTSELQRQATPNTSVLLASHVRQSGLVRHTRLQPQRLSFAEEEAVVQADLDSNSGQDENSSYHLHGQSSGFRPARGRPMMQAEPHTTTDDWATRLAFARELNLDGEDQPSDETTEPTQPHGSSSLDSPFVDASEQTDLDEATSPGESSSTDIDNLDDFDAESELNAYHESEFIDVEEHSSSGEDDDEHWWSRFQPEAARPVFTPLKHTFKPPAGGLPGRTSRLSDRLYIAQQPSWLPHPMSASRSTHFTDEARSPLSEHAAIVDLSLNKLRTIAPGRGCLHRPLLIGNLVADLQHRARDWYSTALEETGSASDACLMDGEAQSFCKKARLMTHQVPTDASLDRDVPRAETMQRHFCHQVNRNPSSSDLDDDNDDETIADSDDEEELEFQAVFGPPLQVPSIISRSSSSVLARLAAERSSRGASAETHVATPLSPPSSLADSDFSDSIPSDDSADSGLPSDPDHGIEFSALNHPMCEESILSSDTDCIMQQVEALPAKVVAIVNNAADEADLDLDARRELLELRSLSKLLPAQDLEMMRDIDNAPILRTKRTIDLRRKGGLSSVSQIHFASVTRDHGQSLDILRNIFYAI